MKTVLWIFISCLLAVARRELHLLPFSQNVIFRSLVFQSLLCNCSVTYLEGIGDWELLPFCHPPPTPTPPTITFPSAIPHPNPRGFPSQS